MSVDFLCRKAKQGAAHGVVAPPTSEVWSRGSKHSHLLTHTRTRRAYFTSAANHRLSSAVTTGAGRCCSVNLPPPHCRPPLGSLFPPLIVPHFCRLYACIVTRPTHRLSTELRPKHLTKVTMPARSGFFYALWWFISIRAELVKQMRFVRPPADFDRSRG